MTMLRKRSLLLISALVVGLLVFVAAPRDTALAIKLGGTLFAGQSVFDNFQYRLLMRSTLHGDASALESLVKFDCGGGAGCYDHGEVLVQLLSQVGDAKFSLMVKELRTETKYLLHSLFAAGFEYGSSVQTSDSEVRFPMTTGVLAALQPRDR
jgi:hypothetical protein